MFAKKLSIFVVFLCAALVFSGCGGGGSCGQMRVRVLDGYTDRPIEGARVTVPETGGSYLTGADGRTEAFGIPVIRDAEYDKLLPNDAGRATLLVTAEGRTPYLLLYARVKEGVCRELDVLLFPADGSLDVFTVIEAPDESWCRELTERFAP